MTKCIFLLPFLFFPSLAFSQTDTVYTVQQGENFFVVTRVTQANGSYTESAQLIGNLNAMSDYSQGFFVRAASSLSQAASVVLRADREWQRAIQQDAGFQAAYNRSPLTEVQMQYDSTLLMDTWQLEQPGASPTPITFSRNAQSKLRATWGGGTAKAAYLVSGTMRIAGFNAAGAMNFYQLNPNLWTDANRAIFIRRTAVNWTPWRPAEVR